MKKFFVFFVIGIFLFSCASFAIAPPGKVVPVIPIKPKPKPDPDPDPEPDPIVASWNTRIFGLKVVVIAEDPPDPVNNSVKWYSKTFGIQVDVVPVNISEWSQWSSWWILENKKAPDQYIKIPLIKKWNLVSIPVDYVIQVNDTWISFNDNNISWSEAIESIIILPFIYAWDLEENNYPFNYQFEPGYSYWIYAYNDCYILLRRQ